jgi:hypothetical protein
LLDFAGLCGLDVRKDSAANEINDLAGDFAGQQNDFAGANERNGRKS